jgi:type VI secretion system secreted protein VgrG
MKTKLLILSAVAAWAAFLPLSEEAQLLNSADSFAVLGATTVTSTGNSFLYGNLGVSPGTSITGFPTPGTVVGLTYDGGTVASQAQADALTAYNTLAGETFTLSLTGLNLGGETLSPGVMNFSSSAQLTGTLTLNANGDPNARFDFQIGSTLTTAANSSVVLENGAQANNVFWQVGSSATLGADTAFSGTILADQDITLDSGASISGRALALTGGVTLNDNIVAVPEPASCWLVVFGASFVGIRQWLAVWQRKAGRC